MKHIIGYKSLQKKNYSLQKKQLKRAEEKSIDHYWAHKNVRFSTKHFYMAVWYFLKLVFCFALILYLFLHIPPSFLSVLRIMGSPQLSGGAQVRALI